MFGIKNYNLESLNSTSNDLPRIKGYCQDCKFMYKDNWYKMCEQLNCIVTPKFYCKDFKKVKNGR